MVNKCGIYKIESKTSKNLYIGSAINIKERFRRHKKDLRKNKHHSIILQRAYNKYGEEDFHFEILEECNIDILIQREQHYLDLLKPSYNICTHAGNNIGLKMSEESKYKRRIFNLKNGIRPPDSTWKKKQKAVLMLNDNKEIINRFDSLSEACRYIGRNHNFVSCITRAIKLNTKSYNYYWKYE